MNQKGPAKCRDRILKALRTDAKTADQLASELFISRRTAYEAVEALRQAGKVHRRFFHNRRTGLPDYLYSAVRFPRRHPIQMSDPRDVTMIVGDWDALDVRRLRQ